jgi:hypothetical protein
MTMMTMTTRTTQRNRKPYPKRIPIQERLQQFILPKQQSITTGLTMDKLVGMENYPKFNQLKDVATHGLQPFLKPEFIPNRGRADFRSRSALAAKQFVSPRSQRGL